MHIDQQEIINSRLGVGFALMLARSTPAHLGYKLAFGISDLIAARHSWALVRAVRTNQWIVSRGKLSGSELDQAVRITLRNTARAIYDFYHYFHNSEAIRRLISFNAPAERLIQQSQTGEAGMVVVGVHLSSFDLGLRAISLLGLRALLLTLTELSGGHQWQLHMRRNFGLDILPANMSTLRQAITYLREGGAILTGVDRPVGPSKYKPRFFGQPSDLPVHHIQLALKADVPIVVAAMIRQADDNYQFLVSEPIFMQPHPDRRTEIISNAEAVLKVAEDFIRQAPQQWSISYPVWPELMDQVPE
jgi:phosphatidylinositol dimannoside acyltransferase